MYMVYMHISPNRISYDQHIHLGKKYVDEMSEDMATMKAQLRDQADVTKDNSLALRFLVERMEEE